MHNGGSDQIQIYSRIKKGKISSTIFLCASESWFVLWIILQKPMQ